MRTSSDGALRADDKLRDFAGVRRSRKPLIAANDNKVIRLAAHNGGCSTMSGMVPCSVARVRFIDGEYAA